MSSLSCEVCRSADEVATENPWWDITAVSIYELVAAGVSRRIAHDKKIKKKGRTGLHVKI